MKYEVGDNLNNCGSLACEGGVAGTCFQQGGIGSSGQGMKVTCNTANRYYPGVPSYSLIATEKHCPTASKIAGFDYGPSWGNLDYCKRKCDLNPECTHLTHGSNQHCRGYKACDLASAVKIPFDFSGMYDDTPHWTGKYLTQNGNKVTLSGHWTATIDANNNKLFRMDGSSVTATMTNNILTWSDGNTWERRYGGQQYYGPALTYQRYAPTAADCVAIDCSTKETCSSTCQSYQYCPETSVYYCSMPGSSCTHTAKCPSNSELESNACTATPAPTPYPSGAAFWYYTHVHCFHFLLFGNFHVLGL